MISENNEKKTNYESNNKANNEKFNINFYSMSQGNNCIAESKLELLPFA